jgi:hypothetical protein
MTGQRQQTAETDAFSQQVVLDCTFATGTRKGGVRATVEGDSGQMVHAGRQAVLLPARLSKR